MTSGDPRNEVLPQLTALARCRDNRQQSAKGIAQAIARAGMYRWVGVYDVGASEIAVVGWTGPAPPTHPRFARAQGLNGQAVRRCETIIVNDVRSNPHYLPTLGSTRAEMVVPILAKPGVVVGTIDIESEVANDFGEADRVFVEQCAMAIRPLFGIKEGAELR